jgi:hypothetical protein
MDLEVEDIDRYGVLHAIAPDRRPGTYKRGGRIADGPIWLLAKKVVEDWEFAPASQASATIVADGASPLTWNEIKQAYSQWQARRIAESDGV